MARAHRLDDVACAICMDSLFNRRDDLDDVMPIATPDCGHVFHEQCLLDWFRIQSQQYLSALRDQAAFNPDRREPSPTLSDAPVECPTCRAECFADPETGQPQIHRLYINLAGDGVGSSSQAGSSPVRAGSSRKGKGKEREVLGLARRAKGLGEEVNDLGAGSSEEDMGGMLRRAEGLRDDLISEKALAGIKTYVGGLNVALNNLRHALENHPTIPTLQAQIAEHVHQLREHATEHRRYETVVLPREVKRAVAAERERMEAKIERIRKEGELVRRELEKEQVARREGKKAAAEREREMEKKVEALQSTLRGVEADLEASNDMVRERSKLLRALQSKADSRKALKAQLAELQAENERLKARLQGVPPAEVTDMDDSADVSVQEIMPPPSSRHAPRRTPRISDITADESLQLDFPSFHDDESFSRPNDLEILPPSSSSSTSRSHPTARTYAFDPSSRDVIMKSTSSSTKTKSKYFGSDQPSSASRHEVENGRPPGVSGRGQEVLVDASPGSSPRVRSRTNPFSTTREASDKRRKMLPQKENEAGMEVIEIPDDSPVKGVVVRGGGKGLEGGGGRDKKKEKEREKEKEKEKSVVDWLGVRDPNGRIKKGVAVGAKVRVRV